MKSFVRSLATFSLVITTVLGTLLTQSLSALALPAEKIIQTLSRVPVFAIADEKGYPLVGATKDNKQISTVFLSQQDANNFLTKLQKEKPDVGKQFKVLPISLADVYKLAEESKKQKDSVNFAYIPVENEVSSAKTILTQMGKEYQSGVPLFFATIGKDKEQSYLVIEKDSQQAIPFFFEKQQLQNMLETLKKQKPELASTAKIEVISLEYLIYTLQNSNDETLTKIMLMPSEESIKVIQALYQNQQPTNTQTKPQNNNKPQNQTKPQNNNKPQNQTKTKNNNTNKVNPVK
jgi:hypothetical protein